MRRARRRIRWSRVLVVVVVLAAFLSAAAAGAVYVWNRFTEHPAVASQSQGTTTLAEDKLNKRINILLLGVDDGDDQSKVQRSDTMIVASINPEDGAVNLLSIPRDTKVSIPGYKGYDKITHAYAYGGAPLAVRTVQEFLNIPIHYYVAADWQGFIKVIDILGGVDLYVEQDMSYQDPYADLDIHLKKGYQHLDGGKAGQYVRFRHDELGDIGRVQRQQRLLKALSDQMFQVGTVFKLPALTSTLQQYVSTDMSIFTMVKIANSIKDEPASALKAEMVPGDFATIDGLSYWIPDKEQTRQVVERMFLKRTTKVSAIPGAQAALN